MHLFLHLISYFKTGSCACWRLCLRIERLELKVPRVRCANVHVSCQMFSSNVLMTQRGRIFIIFCIVFHQTKVDRCNFVCLSWQTDRQTHTHTHTHVIVFGLWNRSWFIRPEAKVDLSDLESRLGPILSHQGNPPPWGNHRDIYPQHHYDLPWTFNM